MKPPATFTVHPSMGGKGETWHAALSRFVREAAAVLTRGVSLEDNCYGEIKRLDGVDPVTFPADVGFSLPGTPTHVQVLSATPRGGTGVRTSGGVVVWRWVPGGTVRVDSIAGLSNGTPYDVVLWIGGG